jgi:replicative DNA helicase
MSGGTYAAALTLGDDEDDDSGAGAAIPGGSKHYEFDLDFQQKIAALTLRDTAFAQMTDGLIRPEYFEDSANATLVSVASRYFERYKKAPGDKVTLGSLLKDALRSKSIPLELGKLAVAAVPALFETDISDRDYVADTVATFARHQAVARATLAAVDLIEKRDFDNIGKLMQSALNIGIQTVGTSYNYADMLGVRTQQRLDEAAGVLPPTGITTGYPVLDSYLMHKGWGRKEMAVLMAGPKVGKSMAMISFGVSAIAHGYTVLYVTLEVGSEIIAKRLDANIAERAINELGAAPHEVHERVKEFTSKAAPFYIEEAPSGTMRPGDLRRLIEKYKSRGIVFDLVIVDYADLMVPQRITDNAQENSKQVYVELRGQAMTEGYALLTATQTNRAGASKAVATMTDIAEDFNKVRIADIVISINATEEERRAGEARLYFAASRNQRTGFSIRIGQDMAMGKFLTKVIGEE